VTLEFNLARAARASSPEGGGRPAEGRALFDSRVFTLPDAHEVAAYLVWRQRDAARNAVQMAAHAAFGHRRLHGVHTGAIREMLAGEAGVDFDSYPAAFRRGRLMTREVYQEVVSFTHKPGRASTPNS
jgi:tRNA(His) guanylyltransferase